MAEQRPREQYTGDLFFMDPLANLRGGGETSLESDSATRFVDQFKTALDAEVAPLSRSASGRPVPPAWDPQALEKRHLSQVRKGSKFAALADFLRRRLALGETVEGIIGYAERYDPATANELRTVAAELGF